MLSFGNEEEIRAALKHIGVDDCFEGDALTNCLYSRPLLPTIVRCLKLVSDAQVFMATRLTS